jgi:signal transduction histidine kinase
MRAHKAKDSSRKRGRSRFDRGLGLTVLTGLALLLVIGVVFSVAYGSQQITRAATDLHSADETLRAATVARAQLALAGYMATVDAELGWSTSARGTSEGEAADALVEIDNGIVGLQASGVAGDYDLRAHGDAFNGTSREILQLLQQDQAAEAQALSEAQLAPQFDVLVGSLVEVRDDLADEVRTSDALLGRVGNVARFLVAFFIPAAVILIYRELAMRRQHEVELEGRLAAERQLAQAREEFIASASHELRTPLTGIAGMAMLLEEDLANHGSDLSKELIDVIIGEASDLSRMVDDLLTTARLDAGALHFAFDDVDVAAEITDTAESFTRSGMALRVDCEPATVRADRTRFRQVVRNLLSNAKKYGGPNVRIEGRSTGNTYLVSVADDGTGLPEGVEEHIFERFVHKGRDSATTDSVGLGLSIVHALVLGMGGAITYERKAHETHFVVRLPLSLDAPIPVVSSRHSPTANGNLAAAAEHAAASLRGNR